MNSRSFGFRDVCLLEIELKFSLFGVYSEKNSEIIGDSLKK